MNAWQTRRINLDTAYRETAVTVATIIAAGLLIALQFTLTDYANLAGNLGKTFANVEVGLGILLALLFGLNAGLLWYKLRLASAVKASETGTTLAGGFLGLLVTGCPACSITLASYLGLASILSGLPFAGLEVKAAGILILVYSTDNLLKKLTTCQASPKNP
ncbi:hypothetical protein KY327_02755 [Candidatus Woesearchaeota archaeon]|nr:hypothetical protein [Candidatus Woesearchaeota archaeon]